LIVVCRQHLVVALGDFDQFQLEDVFIWPVTGDHMAASVNQAYV